MPKGVYKRTQKQLDTLRSMRERITPETHKKRGLSLRGRTPWNKGKRGVQIPWNRGRAMPEISGANHYNWKGGATPRCSVRRREFLKKYGGSHTFGEWENLKAQYNWTCPCCLKREPEIKLTKDHIVPVSVGGSDNIENIQPLCAHCNFKKHLKSIKY